MGLRIVHICLCFDKLAFFLMGMEKQIDLS
jgi:hypothetical protein